MAISEDKVPEDTVPLLSFEEENELETPFERASWLEAQDQPTVSGLVVGLDQYDEARKQALQLLIAFVSFVVGGAIAGLGIVAHRSK